MKNLYAGAALLLLIAGSANARETGIINQAGPYEAQMRFYLHPAHGFSATPDPTPQDASTVGSKASSGGGLSNAARASAPVVRASQPARNRSERVAAAGRG